MPESDVGTFFGKYFLLKKLAAGGMGEVFLAKQQGPAGFEKILIIKKVLAHLTENKEFVELFLGEARLAARMNHRNIVQVFELGEEGGNYFIAMEYVQGKALREVIDAAIKRKEKMPAELCRSIAEQICDGASYAHNLTDISGRGLNIIHRDLNPQNVLVSYTGDVKVIDFGIAKSEMSTVKTEAGMIKGKFVYMSPEQSLAKKLDKRSDIFAIGITLYEMLTGINPFHKNNIVLTLEAVQRYDPPPPSEYDPALAPFDPICAKVLAKDRDRRYSDAGEMLDDLRRIVLPPSPERLGVFMSRIFRAQLEEEQKILKDTDSARVTNAAKAGGRTPSKPVPAMTTHPDGQPPEGATMLLPPKGKLPPPPLRPAGRPAPRAPAPPPKKGAGDTLMDMEAPVLPAAQPDDNPGATMMLKPGQAPPPPPKRKPAITDTMPESAVPSGDGGEGGDNRTAFLGTAPARPEKQRKALTPPPSNGVGGTNIMTPEESQAAQREALAKMQAIAGGVVPAPKPRSGIRAGPAPKKSAGKGLWIALGMGGLVVVGGIVALVLMLLGGDEKPTRRRKDSTPPPVEKTTDTSDEKKPSEERPPPQKAAQTGGDGTGSEDRPAETPRKQREKKPAADHTSAPEDGDSGATKPPEKQAGPDKQPDSGRPADRGAPDKAPEKAKAVASAGSAGKLLGTLMVNPGPNIPLTFNGNAMGKVVGLQRLSVTGDTGTLQVGDATSQFRVELEYARAGKELVFRVKSTPWAIVSVDQISKGKTPLADLRVEDKLAVVELKKPGQDSGMAFRLRYQGN